MAWSGEIHRDGQNETSIPIIEAIVGDASGVFYRSVYLARPNSEFFNSLGETLPCQTTPAND
jgi:hypothetical protein